MKRGGGVLENQNLLPAKEWQAVLQLDSHWFCRPFVLGPTAPEMNRSCLFRTGMHSLTPPCSPQSATPAPNLEVIAVASLCRRNYLGRGCLGPPPHFFPPLKKLLSSFCAPLQEMPGSSKESGTATSWQWREIPPGIGGPSWRTQAAHTAVQSHFLEQFCFAAATRSCSTLPHSR